MSDALRTELKAAIHRVANEVMSAEEAMREQGEHVANIILQNESLMTKSENAHISMIGAAGVELDRRVTVVLQKRAQLETLRRISESERP